MHLKWFTCFFVLLNLRKCRNMYLYTARLKGRLNSNYKGEKILFQINSSLSVQNKT